MKGAAVCPACRNATLALGERCPRCDGDGGVISSTLSPGPVQRVRNAFSALTGASRTTTLELSPAPAPQATRRAEGNDAPASNGLLAPGVVVADRFRLVRELGRGGMGAVWLAHHQGLGVPCAIKFDLMGASLSAVHRRRFEREARAAALLRSSHVVQVLDHGIWRDHPYIAMEYLEGEDLRARLDRVGCLSLEETSNLLGQIARGLSKAHAAAIVHRDLKPDNIFLVPDDDGDLVKIVDFGIAKGSGPGALISVITGGGPVGTPAYMSPEQFSETGEVDHRADLWSLGVIVFECLAGKRPFDAPSVGQVLMRITALPIPAASEMASDLPPGFDAWWSRACARDPATRFQTARELVDAFSVFVACASVPSWSQSQPGLTTVAALAAAAERAGAAAGVASTEEAVAARGSGGEARGSGGAERAGAAAAAGLATTEDAVTERAGAGPASLATTGGAVALRAAPASGAGRSPRRAALLALLALTAFVVAAAGVISAVSKTDAPGQVATPGATREPPPSAPEPPPSTPDAAWVLKTPSVTVVVATASPATTPAPGAPTPVRSATAASPSVSNDASRSRAAGFPPAASAAASPVTPAAAPLDTPDPVLSAPPR